MIELGTCLCGGEHYQADAAGNRICTALDEMVSPVVNIDDYRDFPTPHVAVQESKIVGDPFAGATPEYPAKPYLPL